MRISGSHPAVGPHEPENDPAHHAAVSAAAPPRAESRGFPAPPTPGCAPSALHKLQAPSKPGALLGATTVHVDATGVLSVKFDASSPGNNFGTAGRESTAVSVYVNGTYHSTETILAERADPRTGFGSYKVNLGALPPGDYQVEIRSANDLAGPKSSPAVVRAGSVAGVETAGLEAQVDRYAPLLVTRKAKAYNLIGKIEDALHLKEPLSPMTRTDIPLRMRAEVLGDPAGYHVLAYHTTFSDEDSGTPDTARGITYGRTTDDEWVYKVLLDGQGNRVSPADFARVKGSLGAASMDAPEVYQFGEDGINAKRHVLKPFDGMRAGDRPVIRVSSGNNNFAAVKAGDKVKTPTWSPAIDFDQTRVRYDAARKPISIGKASDKDVLHQFSYVERVTAEEVRREGNL